MGSWTLGSLHVRACLRSPAAEEEGPGPDAARPPRMRPRVVTEARRPPGHTSPLLLFETRPLLPPWPGPLLCPQDCRALSLPAFSPKTNKRSYKAETILGELTPRVVTSHLPCLAAAGGRPLCPALLHPHGPSVVASCPSASFGHCCCRPEHGCPSVSKRD